MSAASETFSPDWLALREPADHRARAADLLPPLCAAWRAAGWRRVLDLGSGAGSNLRYLAPRLPDGQAWTLLDHDADLLARAAAAAEPAQQVTCVRGDLAREGLAAVADAHLVTCSALLDLVTAGWLRGLARACRAASCGVLLALTYDGTMRWDAGSGHAAGRRRSGRRGRRADPAAGERAPAPGAASGARARAGCRNGGRRRCWLREGYRTWRSPSPWRLGPTDAALARELVAGWERAALEMASGGEEVRRIQAWAAARRRTIAGGRFQLEVGHQDLLALPPAERS